MNNLKWALPQGKKVYFASDFHFGAPDATQSRNREIEAVQWLSQCQKDAFAIILLGDVFDFWFETPYLVPKGCIRFLGKLAQLSDKGIKILFFGGNHDMWQKNYFEQEMGALFFNRPLHLTINQTRFYLVHGDGIGPGDTTYKLIKKLIFLNPLLRFVFNYITITPLMAFGHGWRKISLRKKKYKKPQWLGQAEWLLQHSQQINKTQHHHYYVYGHRHLVRKEKIENDSYYVNLGEWLFERNYTVFDGHKLEQNDYES